MIVVRTVCTLALLQLFSFALTGQSLIRVAHTNKIQNIGQQVYIFEDSTANLSFEDIRALDVQNTFSPLQREVFIGQASKSAIWFKMTIKNKTGEDLWLQAGANSGWFLDFYRPINVNGNYDTPVKTGALRSKESKEFPTNFFWFKLTTAEDTTSRTYYLRLETGLSKEMLLIAGTLPALTSNKYQYDLLTGLFVGMMLVMVLYNLFLAYATRDTIYLSYVGYIITTTLVLTFANGYPILKHPFWLEYFFVWSTVMQLFVYLFSSRYLGLRQNAPVLHIISLSLALYLSIAIPLLRILDIDTSLLLDLYHLGMFTFHFVLLYAGYALWRKHNKNASFYIIGWTFLLTSYFVFLFTITGVLPYNFYTRNSIYFGTALEVILFSFALADRLNILRNEKEYAQAQIIETMKHQNLVLEQRVNERTFEIFHRVKNNLQMISSLLSMQERRLESHKEKKALIAAKNRVLSISLIHEHIYNHESLTDISLDQYVTNLTNMLIQNLYVGKKISVQIDTSSLKADIDTAIPIGLILNELITNSLKYAFLDHKNPSLSIQIQENGDFLHMSISDNGYGDSGKKENIGFGRTIIDTLLKNAKGSIEIQSDEKGHHVNLSIKKHLQS